MNRDHKFKETLHLGAIPIGPGSPPFFVAEIGGNHGGDPALARRMIDAALVSGAQAVKFQAYRTEDFLRGDSQYYRELAAEELNGEALAELAGYCRARGAIFLFSVFGPSDVDLAARLDLPAVKISSGDIDNLPLLEAAAGLGKPLILSTGAAYLNEVDTALELLRTKGADRIILLQCTSLYPCPDDQANIRVIPAFQARYRIPVGFSDHTLGVDIPLAAVALGASLVEKHFTIDHDLPGGDNDISCLPEEFVRLVRGSKRIWSALGYDTKQPTANENDLRLPIRRSLVAACDIMAGQTLTWENIGLKRPGGGLDPSHYGDLLGRRVSVHLAKDEPVTWDKVE
jgi:sialic acid synthase SpsE